MNDSTSEFTTMLRALMMPADTNHQGAVFGGVILSRMDQAGYLEARRHGRHRWATVSMESVKFEAPVYVGDLVTVSTRPIRFGTSSIGIEIRVEAERRDTLELVLVTNATLTMVSVDSDNRPIPFSSSPTVDAE